MSLWKFKINDRVKREINIYNRSEGFKFGIITLRYSRPEDQYGDITLGPYKELYDVLWDDGKAERGFLPHGLDKSLPSSTKSALVVEENEGKSKAR